VVGLTAKAGEDRQKAQGGERSSSGGSLIGRKSVRGSWDRGFNDHRILGRVPSDRRHSGSSRGVGLHGTTSTVVLAGSDTFRPVQPTKDGRTARLQLRRRQERREGENEERATGVSEARSHQRRGKTTPTLVTLEVVVRPEGEFSVA
jgi:hypothetical protein